MPPRVAPGPPDGLELCLLPSPVSYGRLTGRPSPARRPRLHGRMTAAYAAAVPFEVTTFGRKRP